MFTLSSEKFSAIPLPPTVTFEGSLGQLDPASNSYYVLSRGDEEFIQCGGGRQACSVEVRMRGAGGAFTHSIVGKDPGSKKSANVPMSHGGTWVQQGEVLGVLDAIKLFTCFYEGTAFPPEYSLRSKALDDAPAAADEASSDGEGAELPVARWVGEADADNVFGVDGFDCTNFVQSFDSTTTDRDIAISFLEQRAITGAELDGKLPPNAVAVVCDLTYPLVVPLANGPLFKAAEMEEKWDIYCWDDRLYFCRSWTGSLIFVAQVGEGESSMKVQRIWSEIDQNDEDLSQSIGQIDYLIKSHVLRQRAPHPLPARLPRNALQVAEYSFGVYGRLCSFGTFGDTVLLKARLLP